VKYLIIGFSAAGANAAETIRRLDPDGEIIVLNGESRSFYLRLDLEGIFQGKPVEQLMPRPPEYWPEKGINVRLDRAVGIDLKKRQVAAQSGGIYGYDRLLIATGARPRKLDVPGCDLAGVFHYHTLDDALAIYDSRARVRHAVIVGGGILGLELAHAVLTFGWKVTILVRGSHAGSPIVDLSGSELVLASLQRAGVGVLFHEQAAAFEGDSRHLCAVRATSGKTLDADLAAICVGVEPDVSFLQDTGLLTDGKLIVDGKMQTAAADVFAAGDAALVRRGEKLVGCNMWNVASAQARVAASNMCGMKAEWREDVLYNLDSLFDQEFALIGPWDDRRLSGRAIHEFRTENAYRALVMRDGVLESALLLGDRTHDRRIRKLITQKARVEEKLDRIFDPDTPPDYFI